MDLEIISSVYCNSGNICVEVKMTCSLNIYGSIPFKKFKGVQECNEGAFSS